MKVQLEAYEILLHELKENSGAYLFSLDLENMMKFNLISHLLDKGMIQNIEPFDSIYAAYMAMRDDGDDDRALFTLLINTLKSGKAYHVIYQYVHNVYLPRRILRKLRY